MKMEELAHDLPLTVVAREACSGALRERWTIDRSRTSNNQSPFNKELALRVDTQEKMNTRALKKMKKRKSKKNSATVNKTEEKTGSP